MRSVTYREGDLTGLSIMKFTLTYDGALLPIIGVRYT